MRLSLTEKIECWSSRMDVLVRHKLRMTVRVVPRERSMLVSITWRKISGPLALQFLGNDSLSMIPHKHWIDLSLLNTETAHPPTERRTGFGLIQFDCPIQSLARHPYIVGDGSATAPDRSLTLWPVHIRTKKLLRMKL
jgi:hypothetical protein